MSQSITKEAFAAMLNGREYRQEMSKDEEKDAKADGLIVIFGASDDLLEFRGAIHDECGAYEGCTALVFTEGVLPTWEDFDEKDDEEMTQAYFSNKKRSNTITAEWDKDGYSWVISAAIPHATFEIVEDGEKYCRGIVIALSDMPGAAPIPTDTRSTFSGAADYDQTTPFNGVVGDAA